MELQYIKGRYNPHRRHSALGNRSPMAYERTMFEAA
jgi:transposase InsO family protein